MALKMKQSYFLEGFDALLSIHQTVQLPTVFGEKISEQLNYA